MASERETRFEEVADCIIKHSKLINQGDYDNLDEIFVYTDFNRFPGKEAELAESFGMMAVKLEAREYKLGQTIEDLKIKNAELDQSLHLRREFGRVFISLMIMIIIYFYAIVIIQYLQDLASFRLPALFPVFTARFLELLLVGITVFVVVRSGLPLSEFGVTFNNARRSLKESMLATVILMAALGLLKWELMRSSPALQGASFLQWDQVDIFFFVYLLVAPIQEFIARGGVQGSMQRLLPGKYNTLWAVVIGSLLFGLFHLHYSVILALATVPASLIWSILYKRHKTLLGVSLSHFIIGNWVILLGFWSMLV